MITNSVLCSLSINNNSGHDTPRYLNVIFDSDPSFSSSEIFAVCRHSASSSTGAGLSDRAGSTSEEVG